MCVGGATLDPPSGEGRTWLKADRAEAKAALPAFWVPRRGKSSFTAGVESNGAFLPRLGQCAREREGAQVGHLRLSGKIGARGAGLLKKPHRHAQKGLPAPLGLQVSARK